MLQSITKRRLSLGDEKSVFQGLVMPLTPRATQIMNFCLESQNNRQKYIQVFQNEFLYGKSMKLWRKQKIKQVFVYIDQQNQNLLWISTKTKAFLLDLTFTTVHRFDMKLEYQYVAHKYVLLRYFQEQYPFLFDQNKQEAEQVQKIFENYINFMKVKNSYPAYFSRIFRLYTMAEVKYQTPYQNTKQILLASKEVGLIDDKVNRQVLSTLFSSNPQNQEIKNQSFFDRQTIINYFKIMYCQQKLEQIFKKYHNYTFKTKNQYLQPLMTKQQFKKFLKEIQKQKQQSINEIIKQFKNKFSFYDFCVFLEDQKINYIARLEPINQNLSLNHYFCYSSHNTYLSGNQLTSDSKVDRYIEDLLNGLKCVQLDVHNNGNTPIITHAFKDRGFSKSIDFQSVITEVARFSYTHPNHYPIILSIQNHANEANCYNMFNILTKQLQNKIVIPGDGQEYYKLCDLKGKIILKTHSQWKSISPMLNIMKQKLQMNQKKDNKSQIVVDHEYIKMIYKIQIPPMAKITALFKSAESIKNINSTAKQCSSLTNVKIIKTKIPEITDYTKRSWLRSYPVGTQVASGNYNPAEMLKVGTQIIALNTQTKDDYVWMMMNYFKVGRQMCPSTIGYISKPIHLRTSQNLSQNKIRYTITPFNRINYQIKMRFLGVEVDQLTNKGSNGIFIVRNSCQGFVMFEINQGKWKDCIPLRFIVPGFRVIVGKNSMFEDEGVRIMCKVQIQLQEKQ